MNKRQSIAFLVCFALIGVSLLSKELLGLRLLAVAANFIFIIAFRDKKQASS